MIQQCGIIGGVAIDRGVHPDLDLLTIFFVFNVDFDPFCIFELDVQAIDRDILQQITADTSDWQATAQRSEVLQIVEGAVWKRFRANTIAMRLYRRFSDSQQSLIACLQPSASSPKIQVTIHREQTGIFWAVEVLLGNSTAIAAEARLSTTASDSS